MDPFK